MRTKHLAAVALFVVAAVVTGAASAGHTSATAANVQSPPLAPLPAGNGAQAFAFDGRFPNVVYIASAHARGGVYVFKTIDGGQHWRATGARGVGWESDILSLTIDPRHRGTLYAGTDTAVYKTVDGGRNWRPFRQGLFPRPHKVCFERGGGPCWKYPYYGSPGKTNWNRNNGWVLDVAVDPVHSNVVYAAAGGIRKSADGGRTWKNVFKPKLYDGVTRIAIASTQPESIYAIVHDRAAGTSVIYKSTDSGRTWQKTGSSLPPSCCGDSQDALAVDPGNPRTVYADVGDTVFATTDGGMTWQPRASGLPVNSVTSLTIDPRQSGTVYASADFSKGDKPTGGIYKTTDGGRSWTGVWSGFGVDKVALDRAHPSTIYAEGWAGRDPSQTHEIESRVLRSTDSGLTWAIAG